MEDVVGDAAEEGRDAREAASARDDEGGVELVGALEDRGGDLAFVRDPECARFEAGLAGEPCAVLREPPGSLVGVLIYLGDVCGDRCGAAESGRA
jgi:hypothetical protein